MRHLTKPAEVLIRFGLANTGLVLAPFLCMTYFANKTPGGVGAVWFVSGTSGVCAWVASFVGTTFLLSSESYSRFPLLAKVIAATLLTVALVVGVMILAYVCLAHAPLSYDGW